MAAGGRFDQGAGGEAWMAASAADGMQETAGHGGGLLGRAVGNGVGIEAESFDFAAGAGVVGRGT